MVSRSTEARTRCRSWQLIIAAWAVSCGSNDTSDPIPVVEVTRDFLTEAGAWRVVQASSLGPAKVEVISPSLSGENDGADMPALVIPPPGEVELVVLPEALPARLVTRVGVDLTAFKTLKEVRRVTFEARTRDRRLAREEIDLVPEQHRENVWRDLGGAAGVELDGSEPVWLRTELLDANGNPTMTVEPILAGFGGLRLERRSDRPRTPASRAHPNVVLMVMDTLRADRLSTYGYSRPTAPHLDALARRGVRFERADSSASWTWPATASILTGLRPMEHGVVNEAASYLVEAADTLAEGLQGSGFTTAAWSGNPIVSASRNFDQGFEQFWTAPGAFQKTGEFFEEVRAFLRARRGQRFFLYLHLVEPHTQLRPLAEGIELLAKDVPADFIQRCDGFWHATSKGQAVRPGGLMALDEIASPQERAWTSELYDASVWSGDHWLGAVLAELEALELTDQTIVAFSADHGEELFERGFLGHGQSLKDELVRVPLVLAGPGVPAGQVQHRPISTRVLAPLLARLAGIDFAEGGEALAALLQDQPFEDHVLFSSTKGSWKGRNNVRLFGITDGTWKLTHAVNGAPWGAEPTAEGDWELIDLSSDAG